MELDDSYFPNLGTINYTDNFSEVQMALIGFCL
ncbi:MAG: hypothetical protein Ct9H90mP6_01830 [Gammaproteobacteria bacterium]|nr:MAG: hypothetical protein Ct9H90mP6_01830 [Gammaproteobacteria bacterium]